MPSIELVLKGKTLFSSILLLPLLTPKVYGFPTPTSSLTPADCPNGNLSSFLFLNNCIYLFLALLGHCCCAGIFSSCSKWELFFVAAHGLLIVVASLVLSTGSTVLGLQ